MTFGYFHVTNESSYTKDNAFLRLHITANDKKRLELNLILLATLAMLSIHVNILATDG
jgi:hypothetical protein